MADIYTIGCEKSGGIMAVSKSVLKSMENSSWIRKMFEAGGTLKAKYGANNVYDFSIGNPFLEPPEDFAHALINYTKDIKPGRHAYMPNAGYQDVRESVAAWISRSEEVKLTADNIIMTCGAAGGINIILKTILNPGDNIIVITPYFAEYDAYISNHCGEILRVSSDISKDFDLDVKAIEKAINDKTQGIIINSPNNPSGKVYSEQNIKELSEMLDKKSRERGRAIYLLSDEPYRKIVYDGIAVPSVMKNYKNSIVINSYSKDLSLPGERIGWVALNPEAEDIANLTGGAIMCNRVLGYVNAPAIMQKMIAQFQGRSVDISFYEKKRNRISEILSAIGYEFVKPEGAFYLFPKAPGGDDLKAVEALQDERILVVPGRGFGTPGYFRLAYCVSDEVIEGCAEGFKKAFDRLTK